MPGYFSTFMKNASVVLSHPFSPSSGLLLSPLHSLLHLFCLLGSWCLSKQRCLGVGNPWFSLKGGNITRKTKPLCGQANFTLLRNKCSAMALPVQSTCKRHVLRTKAPLDDSKKIRRESLG